jgi:hypothetical protein
MMMHPFVLEIFLTEASEDENKAPLERSGPLRFLRALRVLCSSLTKNFHRRTFLQFSRMPWRLGDVSKNDATADLGFSPDCSSSRHASATFSHDRIECSVLENST